MKPRNVIITLEADTDATMKDLKRKSSYDIFTEAGCNVFKVNQVQVNVVKKGGKK